MFSRTERGQTSEAAGVFARW